MDYIGGFITKNPVAPTEQAASGVWRLNQALQYTKAGTWPPNVTNPISKSVRLRASAPAYFSRTPSTATNRSTWTYSAWIKKSPLDYNQSLTLLSAGSFGSDLFTIQVTDNGSSVPCIAVYGQISGSAVLQVSETPARRDPSAWFHLVVVLDTTQATASNRLKLYYNGQQVTALTTATYPNQNTTFAINNNQATAIGSRAGGGAPYYDGYMTEINFIDGQALTPSSFGATDAITGVWNPIAYTGTYGTNGFYLNFKDATSTTTIGYDYSGNSNNWTANNISVTAGSTYDSMVDSPTNYGADTGVGGTVRGNYPTFNPLDVSTGSTAQTITQGNLTLFSSSTTRIDGAYSTMAVSSGKWYVEMTLTTRTNDYPTAGWGSTSFNSTGSGWQYQAGGSTNPPGACVDPYGRLNCNATNNGPVGGYFGVTWAQGDIIQVAVDIDNKLIWFGKANSWSGTAGNMNGSPSAGTNGTSFAAQGGTTFKFQSCIGDSAKGDVNFGQRAFAYTAPSGFKALCTQNLPTSTVSNGANYMAALLYTGTGVLTTRSGLTLSSAPGLVWIKSRSAATSNVLEDSNRGTSVVFADGTNSTAAEGATGGGWIQNLSTTGFSTDVNSPINTNAATYVAWVWAGASNVSNTSGSITSTVSANTTAGFSVVTYTGNGTSGATIGHGLGATASFIILKRRDGGSGYSWYVQHPTLGPTKALFLDSTNTGGTSSGYWNNTAPTSNVFSVGNDTSLNASGGTYVAYCWATITGYSAFGSYTGNGSSDGPFVYCGFRPRWILFKSTGTVANWWIIDTSRNTYNVANALLTPSNNYSEDTSYNVADVNSNGFKLRTTYTSVNTNGDTVIYAAFAENPFKIARAR